MSRHQRSTRGTRRGIGGLPLRPAALGGAVSFVVGYLLTYLLKIGDVNEALRSPLLDLSGLPTPGDWQVIGWFFLSAHNVAVTVAVGAGATTTTRALGIDVPTWLLLVPIGLLVVAGFAVVRYAQVSQPARGAMAGAAVALPYLVLAVLLTLLSAWTVGGGGATVRVAPALLTGVLVAGVAYPVVFGGLGGALGAIVTARD